jgi:uncharacterized protein (DUF486 family)
MPAIARASLPDHGRDRVRSWRRLISWVPGIQSTGSGQSAIAVELSGAEIGLTPTRRVTMPGVFVRTVLLLTCSNVFMTFAWYAHLRILGDRKWYVAAIASWGIALFEYLLQVPANRIGYTQMSLPQLKILQEAITLTVFVPFALLYMKQPLKLDYLWAGRCILGAVYFMFRGSSIL